MTLHQVFSFEAVYLCHIYVENVMVPQCRIPILVISLDHAPLTHHDVDRSQLPAMKSHFFVSPTLI